jgi:hypothetical protein
MAIPPVAVLPLARCSDLDRCLALRILVIPALLLGQTPGGK